MTLACECPFGRHRKRIPCPAQWVESAHRFSDAQDRHQAAGNGRRRCQVVGDLIVGNGDHGQ